MALCKIYRDLRIGKNRQIIKDLAQSLPGAMGYSAKYIRFYLQNIPTVIPTA